MTRLFRFSLAVAAAIGCSSDFMSPQFHAFRYAAAAGGCGPAGGPAVVVFLAPVPVVALNPSPPVLWVFIPVGPRDLTAHAWPIGTNEEAAAWFKANTSTSAIAAAKNDDSDSISNDRG